MTIAVPQSPPSVLANLKNHPGLLFGLLVVAAMIVLAVAAPWLGTTDPSTIRPRMRLQPAFGDFWLGTDSSGRDLWSRIAYGARISIIVGATVASISMIIGLIIGTIAGATPRLDGIIMRIMDGAMAIPAILFAIMVVTLFGATLATVIIAITLPEIPRVVRLTRSVVLAVRNEAYVEAAISMGTSKAALIVRHILPNVLAPVVVQSTFIASAAILLEAALSFLGMGTPSETPSWGNIMADGRYYFQMAPQLIILPGLMVALTVLAVNMIGDGLRDLLDPRFAKSVGEVR